MNLFWVSWFFHQKLNLIMLKVWRLGSSCRGTFTPGTLNGSALFHLFCLWVLEPVFSIISSHQKWELPMSEVWMCFALHIEVPLLQVLLMRILHSNYFYKALLNLFSVSSVVTRIESFWWEKWRHFILPKEVPLLQVLLMRIFHSNNFTMHCSTIFSVSSVVTIIESFWWDNC
jgi:hypothetical protein